MSKYAAEGAGCVFCCQIGRCYQTSDFILRNSLFDILRFLCLRWPRTSGLAIVSLLSMWGMNDATRASEIPRNLNAKTNRLAEALRGMSPDVLSEAARKEASAMIERDLRRRTRRGCCQR